MRAFRLWKLLIAMAAWLCAAAHGETIDWFCSVNKTNLTGGGQDMDSGFQFQLGVFTGGFVPTAGNTSQWATYWASAQSSAYNASTKSFGSSYNFAANTAPFTAGAKAYIWGRRTSTTSDEWILFRKSDWNWPVANPMNPPGTTQWSVASANEVVLGSINSGGTPFLMKSETVFSYAQWRNSQLAGEMLQNPNDDPDHDGSPNLLEFVFGTSPTQAGAPTATPVSIVEVSGSKYVQISIPRLRNRLAMVSVEVSNNLVGWNSGSSYTVELSNTPEVIVVRDLVPIGPGLPPRFIRARLVTPP